MTRQHFEDSREDVVGHELVVEGDGLYPQVTVVVVLFDAKAGLEATVDDCGLAPEPVAEAEALDQAQQRVRPSLSQGPDDPLRERSPARHVQLNS